MFSGGIEKSNTGLQWLKPTQGVNRYFFLELQDSSQQKPDARKNSQKDNIIFNNVYAKIQSRNEDEARRKVKVVFIMDLIMDFYNSVTFTITFTM